jgi:hypothetical protein
MNTQLRKNYVERIRNTSTHSTLRLLIDLVAGLWHLGLIGLAIVLLVTRQPLLGLCYLVLVMTVVLILRNLAILVVDIADMLIEQGIKEKVGDDNVDAEPLLSPRVLETKEP